MVQIFMLVVGVWYVYKLLTMGSAASKLQLPPEVLAQWRAQRKRQYLWGIAAGWGSLVATVITASATINPNGYYTASDALNAEIPVVAVGLIILFGGIVLSIRADRRAKSIERGAANSGYGMPGAYPPPAQPGAYPPGWQPGAYPPPAKPDEGQPTPGGQQ
jgi:hypothetical protein